MRRFLRRIARGGVLAGALAGPLAALAEGPTDLLFNTPHLRGVQAGDTLRYDHARVSDPALAIGPDFDQTIALAMGQGGAERFTLDADGVQRSFDVDDKVPGNPLLMVFLENAVRSVAKATGGSEFYLRNRVKEGLRDGLTAEGDVLTMRPFTADANRARMGPFADMALSFEVSPDAPGMLVAMRAEAGTAYREEIVYEAAE